MESNKLSTYVLRFLFIILSVVILIVLSYCFAKASYDVLSVTPLYFIRFANYLMPISILFVFIGLLLSIKTGDKMMFILTSLILYFIILYAPYNIFPLYVYNDQLGFALETFSGMWNGIVAPYQGEPSTLGHAFFTAILGEVVGLSLFQATRLAEIIFVLVVSIICSTLSMPFLKNYESKEVNTSLAFLIVIIVIIFPAFILEPLLYSRGYFGIVMSMLLILCMLKLLKKMNKRNIILTTIVFIASSISYPLGPLMIVIAMTVFIFLSMFLSLIKRVVEWNRRTFFAIFMAFSLIWSAIQVYLGYGSWAILHEIILKILSHEYFTALEAAIALRYVGEAAIYSMLRLAMILIGWLISALIALLLFLKFLKNRRASQDELYALSLLIAFGLFGIIYGITFHEPALRFYRGMVAVLPFTLVHIADHDIAKRIPNKPLIPLLFIIVFIFLTLAPITKWGWTFVGYPTKHDIALSSFIISYYQAPHYIIYSPGSFELLGFCFQVQAIMSGGMIPSIVGGDDVYFDSAKMLKAVYTATFYRIFIYPRWLGKNNTIIHIYSSVLENNLLYNDEGLWLLMQRLGA